MIDNRCKYDCCMLESTERVLQIQ